MEIISIQEIIKLYPNEWILIGNPTIDKENFVGPMIKKISSGIVLNHSKNKSDLINNNVFLNTNIIETACIFTGKVIKNRKFLAMSKFGFNLNDEESLIIVNCKVNRHNFSLALDTGATHTIIDLTALLIMGFTLNDVIKTVQLETGKGIVDAYVFKVSNFTSLEKVVTNMEICAYDFIGNSIFSDFEGVLGLDFLRKSELNINFIENTIELK